MSPLNSACAQGGGTDASLWSPVWGYPGTRPALGHRGLVPGRGMGIAAAPPAWWGGSTWGSAPDLHRFLGSGAYTPWWPLALGARAPSIPGWHPRRARGSLHCGLPAAATPNGGNRAPQTHQERHPIAGLLSQGGALLEEGWPRRGAELGTAGSPLATPEVAPGFVPPCSGLPAPQPCAGTGSSPCSAASPHSPRASCPMGTRRWVSPPRGHPS